MGYNNPYHLLLLLSITTLHFLTTSAGKVTAIYAFGDAILDSGNNNNLDTICKSNHEPYGIRFPGGIATGRFTDGKLITDILISDFKLKSLLPAFLDESVTAKDLLTGASFASACSGLDDETADTEDVLSMPDQVGNYKRALERMQVEVGVAKANAAVEKALFLVSAGSSDMMDYYKLPARRRKHEVPAAYHAMLIMNLGAFVKNMHQLGAKRMVVMGMPPLGCLPMDVSKINFNRTKGKLFRRECKPEHNSDAQDYNTKLQKFVKKVIKSMPSLKIAYMDFYNPLMDIIKSPKSARMKKTLVGCCGEKTFEMGPLCSDGDEPCKNPSEYLFWDSAHPTEATYAILTKIMKSKVLPTVLKE